MILFQIYWVKHNVSLKLISPVLFSFLSVGIRKCKCGLHRFVLDRTTLDTQPSRIKCVMGKLPKILGFHGSKLFSFFLFT